MRIYLNRNANGYSRPYDEMEASIFSSMVITRPEFVEVKIDESELDRITENGSVTLQCRLLKGEQARIG